MDRARRIEDREANGPGRMESLNRIQKRRRRTEEDGAEPSLPSLHPSSSNTNDDDDVGTEERGERRSKVNIG